MQVCVEWQNKQSSDAPTQCAKCATHTGTRIVNAPNISGKEEIFEIKVLFMIVLTFSELWTSILTKIVGLYGAPDV